MCYLSRTPQLYTHTFSLSSPLTTKRSQTLKIQRCKRSGTKSPATGERRSEGDRERYRAAVHHGIATESQGRYSLVRLRGDRRPQGGVYVALQAPLRRARSTLTDAPRGLSSTHI